MTTNKNTKITKLPDSIVEIESNIPSDDFLSYEDKAFARIKEANNAGYYLESITLIESMLSDRLESRLTYLLKTDFSFKNLGSLIKKAREIENDSILLKYLVEDLDLWRDARNKALHEMVKIADGETITWNDRVKVINEVSSNGLTLLRAIDNRLKALKPKKSRT